MVMSICASQTKDGSCNLYRGIASRFNFWLTMPLAVRSTCHVWSSARIQQIWKNIFLGMNVHEGCLQMLE